MMPEKQNSHQIIDGLLECLNFVLRENFDYKRSRRFINHFGLEKLQFLLNAFKEAQIFPLLIKSLQSLRKHLNDEECTRMEAFIVDLQTRYGFCKQKDDMICLQTWTQINSGMSQMICYEVNPKNQNRAEGSNQNGQSRVISLLDECVDCLEFLDSNSFKSNGRVDFNGFGMTRQLQGCCLCFKFMQIPGLFESRSASALRGLYSRGRNVVVWKCKRKVCLGDTGYEFIEFLAQTVSTKSVKVMDAYFIIDHKPQDEKQKSMQLLRHVAGPVFYLIMPDDAEAQKLLRLAIAWAEPRNLRKLVFRDFGELFKLQMDGLNDAQDRARSEKRQEMVRKLKSRKTVPSFKEVRKNGVQTKELIMPTPKEAQKELEIRRVLCTEKIWSQKYLQIQKQMYHISFALPKDQGSNVKELTSVESRRGSFDSKSTHVAGS